jgi:hypothetical protein
LRDEHDGDRVPARGLLERRLHPRNVGRVSRSILCYVETDTAQIVAAALNIQGRVHDAANCPSPVFDATLVDRTGVRASQAQRVRLYTLTKRVLPERVVVRVLFMLVL